MLKSPQVSSRLQKLGPEEFRLGVRNPMVIKKNEVPTSLRFDLVWASGEDVHIFLPGWRIWRNGELSSPVRQIGAKFIPVAEWTAEIREYILELAQEAFGETFPDAFVCVKKAVKE